MTKDQDKNVLIVSYNFWPEQTPRAFRAHELAKELVRRNYNITIITKKIRVERNFQQPFLCYEIPVNSGKVNSYVPSKLLGPRIPAKPIRNYKKPGVFLSKLGKIQLSSSLHFWKYFFWPAFWSWEFAHRGDKFLKNRLDSTFDLTISIDSFGLPSHSLTYRFWKQGVKLGKVIGDCGDPFTFNPSHKFSLNHYIRERRLLSCFDYITIPTPNATRAFTKLGISLDRIRIIPQGFSFELPQKKESNDNTDGDNKTVLVYGGKFKKKIRNPENFFNALILLKKKQKNICCRIYTDLHDPYIMFLRNKYRKELNGVLEYNEIIMREEFLSVIQQADLVLNFVNKSKYQVPSKLIDYAIARANIIDIDMQMTPEDIASKIVKNECYTSALRPEFKIENVVDKFIELMS